jgi:hypothetical protein
MDIKTIFVNNKNIIFNILTNLIVKDRYYFSLVSIDIFNKYFCKFKHSEYDKNIIDISSIKNYFKINKLCSRWKENFNFRLNISRSTQIINNISLLSNIYMLDLSFTIIKDVSMLCNIHTLYLNGCNKITNISISNNDQDQKYCNKTKWNCHILSLCRCENLMDISALGGVHTLYLECCNKITDVSMLGNVHTLYLNNCNGITDVSMLDNVYELDLSYCLGITLIHFI